MSDGYLDGDNDIFGGRTIKTDEQAGRWKSDAEFEEKLKRTLDLWQKSRVRGVWIRVSIQHASLVDIAVKHGFVFHHAKPEYVMMTRWLPTDEPNVLPGFANHYIGVGGFVLNDKNEVLSVTERFHLKPHLKLPGGAVNTGENLADAVRREVLEETGIETEFLCIVCFRHLQDYQFNQSDIYFVCLLRPLTQEIKMNTSEIRACKWIDVKEFMEHKDVSPMASSVAKKCLQVFSKGKFKSKTFLEGNQISDNAILYSLPEKR